MAPTVGGAWRRASKEWQRLGVRFTPRAARSLTDLANLYRSDKGTLWFNAHGYTRVYEQLFAPFRERPITLLEIGLRHQPYYRRRSTVSPSLQMWLDYFPHATICGFDIKPFASLGSPRVRIFQGDQGHVSDLRRMLAEVAAFDIIIDDGSHASHHQRVTFETLWPAVRPGGLYVIEDLQWQPPDLEASLPPTPLMRDLLQSPEYLSTVGTRPEHVTVYPGGALGVIRRP